MSELVAGRKRERPKQRLDRRLEGTVPQAGLLGTGKLSVADPRAAPADAEFTLRRANPTQDAADRGELARGPAGLSHVADPVT